MLDVYCFMIELCHNYNCELLGENLGQERSGKNKTLML